MGITSCSTDDNSWRDSNLAFFDGLYGKPGIQEIGDTSNAFPGIMYLTYATGTGRKPVVGERVKVIYSAWLWNEGLVYNDSLKLKNAFDYSIKGSTFTLGASTISGFTLALQNMNVGSKWRIFIPYYLGYGSSGTTAVKAYSTLIFDVELKSIVE